MKSIRSGLSALCIVLLFAASLAVSAETADAKVRIIIIGDSTVQTYPPERGIFGWGQMIGDYVSEDVVIINESKSGRSTKTFIEEGLWKKAVAKDGDYILIQFGHNDSHTRDRPESTDSATDYHEYLRQYIDEARQSGAVPILVTPMHRRLFKGGIPTTELLPYADAMRIVADEKKVLLIDLHESSGLALAKLGDDGSADLYCSPKDRTHFSAKGARLMAKLVANDLKKQVSNLERYIMSDERVVRHVVLFKFKDEATKEQIGTVEDAFRELPGKIDAIYSYEWGTNISPENLAQGFTHCFFLTFLTEADRDAYLPHPAHKAFGKVLRPFVDKVLVVDYLASD